MPTPLNLTGCLPSNPAIGAKIKVDGYNLWAVWNGSIWVPQTTNPGGKSTTVNVIPCLPASPDPNDYYTWQGSDYYFDTSTNKWKCGRPN